MAGCHRLSASKKLVGLFLSRCVFRLKNLAGRYDIIHIASHAEFDSKKPLQSCLRLAASEKEDGRLTTKEVFNINLDAYLVTLSGCETALGKITNGDEVTGLSRAFIYAGTPSLLGTLWRVHDESTKMLMEKFYLNLQRMDKFKALQQAQLDMLNDPVYGKPFFWAPFQITGDYY
jgi:CHAT domain-containing protein